ILKEKSTAQIMLQLQELDVLVNIHPEFRITSAIEPSFELLEQFKYPQCSDETTLLGWYMLMATVPFQAIEVILENLLVDQNKANDTDKAVESLQHLVILMNSNAKPIAIVKLLNG